MFDRELVELLRRAGKIWIQRKGLEIIEGLRGHISGLGSPTYVVDGLHGAGKIPLMPNYLVSAGDNAVILRNYEGMLFRYAPEGGDGDPVIDLPIIDRLS